MTDTDDIDGQVKAADPDRWLAARFVGDAQARADLMALYALNHVLSRIASQVSEEMLGHIRLAWWREAIEELAAGKAARAHPVVEALAEPITRGAFDPADLEALVEGRAGDLDPRTFDDEPDIYAHIDITAGRLAAIAAKRLDPSSPPRAVDFAIRAWGLAGLARSGRLPPAMNYDIPARVAAHLEKAREPLKALPVAAFPAVAYAALALPYARGREPGPLEKRARLLLATLKGAP